MRVWALAVLPLVGFSGCFTQVVGDAPEKACGSTDDPAHSVIVGTEASWAGRWFTANADGVTLKVRGGEGDLPTDGWWGINAKAWAVAALNSSYVKEARAGLVQYDSTRTTIHVGGGGTTYPQDADMFAADAFIGPLTLSDGESVLVVGTADTSVSSLSLLLEWTGCGQTGEILFGSHEGFVAGWSEFEAPVLLSNVAYGTVAYDAHFERPADFGIVLTQPPPGNDAWGRNEASITTSGGTTGLDGLTFLLHEGGKVSYDVTHFGETGDEPLVAYLPLETGGATIFPLA